MDIIEISNLRLRCVIGFSAHELPAAQDIVISLRIGTDRHLANESDEPADALNYKTLAKATIALVESSRFSLVEKLAEQIACRITVGYGAPWVEVAVHKPGALRHADSVAIRIQRRPGDYAENQAYISIGSNIAPEENIVACVHLLRRYTTVLALSPVYRSTPQGYTRQASFLNMAAKVHTLRRPADFKAAVIDRIEAELGRKRDPSNKNAPRTIDLDLSLWNSAAFQYGAKPWPVPDPDILRYAHVAAPLADLAPDYKHPLAGKPLRQIAGALDACGLEPVELDLGAACW